MRKKSEERRQAMIDIAGEVFNEIGFEGASMAEISARIGGSKATLYNYCLLYTSDAADDHCPV